ncbi:type I phosphodiesterase/nucleotide pyrophosphatase [Arthrobacter crystallopoietes BAB-32]|uniref:Type I phosphodiesterase/nucleotide pyrophosphatase n=1 Tax=Arthrobacter crystallopoietes BAB-32 TaxID=1246476 RepID=N1V079_9MICC|nr:alkaline phosphatase family protein [Arthrobacter crystallopoietes]EMY34705.1 type I phosphodiesterase/nucleotide pyrophosphatase [Arthrobacter crystallopoietes BAB-32]
MSGAQTSGRTGRRSFLKLAAASGAAVVLSAAPGAGWAAPGRNGGAGSGDLPKPKVYVLVVDGCRPDEITAALTPNLAAMRDGGANFPAARSLPIMETIPNHVMMMTGLRPDRTGVPANSVYDRAEGAVRRLDRPSDLRAVTLLERLNAAGFTTGTVLSKEYLYGIFGDRATYRWEPAPIVPVSGHAPDASTVDALIGMVDSADPDLVFTNLGDVDRMGHSDLTGTTLQAARTAALASTDLQVGRFIRHLKARGTWENSVVMVLADHSMDWSLPTNVISIDNQLWLHPELRRNVQIAQNGGADLLYWTGDAAAREESVARLAAVVAAHPGVLSVHPPAELRLGPEAGDLAVYCRAGWRFSDPYILSNPIPGNHGHPATEPIPFFIGGGSPSVLAGVSSEPARTVDVAPTVAALFGLDVPEGGYDGTPRTGALALA